MKRLGILPFVAVLSMAFSGVACAEVFFHEDFESDIYSLDLPIPMDYGVIRHGKWNAVPKEARPGTVVLDDGNRVLELKAVSGFTRGSRAIGTMGQTNEAESVTEEALRFRFRFKMTAPLGESLYFQLGGTDGRSKAVLTMDDGGGLLVSFGGERKSIGGALESHHWYTVEILLPAKPRTNALYTVHLFDGETEIGQAKGRMARSMEVDGANYRYFDFQHNRPGEALFVDDILIETRAESGQ